MAMHITKKDVEAYIRMINDALPQPNRQCKRELKGDYMPQYGGRMFVYYDEKYSHHVISHLRCTSREAYYILRGILYALDYITPRSRTSKLISQIPYKGPTIMAKLFSTVMVSYYQDKDTSVGLPTWTKTYSVSSTGFSKMEARENAMLDAKDRAKKETGYTSGQWATKIIYEQFSNR